MGKRLWAVRWSFVWILYWVIGWMAGVAASKQPDLSLIFAIISSLLCFAINHRHSVIVGRRERERCLMPAR